MKIIVISGHTSSLFWFRMDFMKKLVSDGHQVIALGPDNSREWAAKFQENEIEYKQYYIERTGMNPLKDFKTFLSLKKLLKDINPDKVFTYQAKPIIYGNLAARLNGIDDVYTLVAGLGSIFRGVGLKNKIIRAILKLEYRAACKVAKVVFFQNNDDKGVFIKNKIVEASKTAIINGSGVNLEKFKQVPLPENPSFLFIGRLLRDKGVIEYLEACRIVKNEMPEVECHLVGPFDSNPSSISRSDLEEYIDEGVINYHGEQSDVRPYIRDASVFVLPSYHEGTPKTVLESMAMGRAIITTDAPGCRETVTDGYNGYLVQVRDIANLSEKMISLVSDRVLLDKMASRNVDLAKNKYDVNLVNRDIIKYMGLK